LGKTSEHGRLSPQRKLSEIDEERKLTFLYELRKNRKYISRIYGWGVAKPKSTQVGTHKR